jgi:hypothetical protein
LAVEAGDRANLAKAQLVTGTADWPTYLGELTQETAVGGVLLFGLATIWLFGREYSHRTATDLLALPTGPAAIVAAKFLVVAVWSAMLVAIVFLLGLAVGRLVGLPAWSVRPAPPGGWGRRPVGTGSRGESVPPVGPCRSHNFRSYVRSRRVRALLCTAPLR